MQTPSLGRRVVVLGGAIVTILVLCLDLLLYVSLRSSLDASLDRDLRREVDIVREESLRVPAHELPGRLRDLGVMANLRDGSAERSAGPNFAGLAVTTREVPLSGGGVAEVAVSRTEADRAVRRLVTLEAVISPLVILLALLLLRLIAEIALRPLDRIAEAARRTTEGHRGERLRPDRTDTRLGQMASAYDAMLDALESAMHEAEAARAESERLLERNRRIIETAREAFVAVDEEGLIVDWNDESERTFGWARAEAIGRPVVGTIVPADPALAEDVLGPLRGGANREPADRLVEVMASHRSGRSFPARMAVWATTHDGHRMASAFIWDITDQLRAEEAMSRLAAVVESADDAMMSTTLDGIILTWNPAAERMYGYPAAAAVGRSIDIVVPLERREETARALAGVAHTGNVQRLERTERRTSGMLVDVSLTVTPVRDRSGSVQAASWVARDVTEERWIASQLDRSLRDLERALAEATASEVETRRFLDDAAHQLRAPITNIRACAEGLLFTNDDSARDELLGALVRETGRAGRLMAGLLRMAQINHQPACNPLPCDVVAICEHEADKVRALMPEMQLRTVAPDGQPALWPALDPSVVTEIVANLLDNARRHARTSIDVVVHFDPEQVVIVVADDGDGLPADMAETAFERFVSLDGRGGSGLGLPIAREMARAHGGDLIYRDEGFVVLLPVPSRAHLASPAVEPTLAAP